MCIILIFFPFSISLLKIWTIPSLECVLSIRPLRFSSRHWGAILLFVGVKLPFRNILCNFCRPIDDLSIFFKPFLTTKVFLHVFYYQIVRLSFLSSFLIFLCDGKLQYLELIHLHQPYFKYFLHKVLILSIIWNPSDFKVIPLTILLYGITVFFQ